jgi:hypothetical protein
VPRTRATVEQALTELVMLVRRPPSDDPEDLGTSGEVPEDLQTEEFTWLTLLWDESSVLDTARSLLATDLRFEYLRETEARDLMWRFACLAHQRRKDDLVREFVAQHAREPMQRTCFFPVELLTTKEAVTFHGVKILPSEAVERPPILLGRDPGPLGGSVVAVKVVGTHYGKMSERARPVAERALRLLRATLREERWLADDQVRFRLGELVWFDDSVAAGWERRHEEGLNLELHERLLDQAASTEISRLPDTPGNDVQRRAELALEWFERAQLATDPIVELLYLFFALEGILGDKSERLKGPALALRRFMLGVLTSGGSSHPTRTYLLYDRIRSTSVHGEKPPTIDEREVSKFAWDVRRAINEFLEFARTEGLTKRVQVRKALDQHQDRATLEAALLKEDPKLWKRYFDPPEE